MSEMRDGTRNTRSIRWTPGLLQLPAPVADALTLFAERTRAIALNSTGGWLIGAGLLLFTGLAIADTFIRLETTTRQTGALVAYLLCAVQAQWMLSRALRPRSPEDIAIEMENRAPAGLLEERLITTVELSTRRANASFDREDEGIAQPLADRVADEAAQLLVDADIESWADRGPERRGLRFGAAILILALALCLIPGLSMPIRYARAILPWIGMARPSQTQISLVPRNPRVVEGAEITFEAELLGEQAPDCFLETREARGTWRRTRMERPTGGSGPFTLKLGPVSTALQYRAIAGDGETVDYEIDVLPRPDIATLNFTVKEPAYTLRPPQSFERASGDVEILRGSTIELAVKSTVPLSGAVLEFNDGRRVTMTVDGVLARAGFDVTRDLSYRVRLQSKDGVDNPDSPLFGIRALADRAPQVSILQPSPDTDADPAQIQTLDVRIEDDIGLRSAKLVVRTDRRANPSNVNLSAPDAAAKNWILSHPWDLAGLFPEEGEILYYRVEAIDSAGVTGRSDERRLRVTSGMSRGSGRVLLEIERAQKSLQAATKQLQTALRDASEIQQVFRPKDLDTRSAERLLLDDTLRRAVSELRTAAGSLERAQAQADGTTLNAVLSALRNGLIGLSDGDLGSLQRAAARLHGTDPQRIQAGLDALLALAPPAQTRLETLHAGLTAAQRYVGAMQLEARANEIREIQGRITPVLVGASGWSNELGNIPGLQLDVFKGVELAEAVHQSTELRVNIKDSELPVVGKVNFSLRYTGEVQAPRAGRYTFRVSSDDGVRVFVAGKKLIDEWRSQGATVFDGSTELGEGWHALVIEYFQGSGNSELTLQRSGPGIPLGEIQREHLRRRAQVQRMQATEELKIAMKQGASPLAVQNALVRQQSIVRMVRALPPALTGLADLPPAADAEGKAAGAAWNTEIAAQTAELVDLRTLHAGVAKPMLNWQAQTPVWSERFAATRARYQKDLEAWAKRLTNDRFDFASRLRNMQRRAAAANKAFQQLAEAAKKPENPQRESDMNRADAAIRALSQDLQRQTQEIARDLNAWAGDPRRRIQDRQVFKALESRVRELALDPGAELERRLEEARDPEQLAQSADKTPNFGAQANQMSGAAAELAARADQFERLRAATERANEVARANAELRAALERPATLETAGQQRRAAQALRSAAQQLAEQVLEPMDGATADAARQTADSVLNSAALKRVEERATKMAAGDFSLEAPPTEELSKAGAQHEAVLAASGRAMEQLANQLNGSAATDAQEAAKRAAMMSTAVNALETNPAALSQATQHAEQSRRKLQSLAERLALEAESQREKPTPVDTNQAAAQAQAAENKMRLAALVSDAQQRSIGPLARDLSSHIGTPDEGTRAQLRKQAEEAAARVDAVSKLVEGLLSPNKELQKPAVTKLNQELATAGVNGELERALERGKVLNAAAEALAKLNAPTKTPDAKKKTATEIAEALARETEQTVAPRRVALAERTAALADRLRTEAEAARVAAQRIQGVGVQQGAAREALGRELPQAVQALKGAAKDSSALADVSGALSEAAKALEGLQTKTANASSAEIEQRIAAASDALAKPLNDLSTQTGDAARQDAMRGAGGRLRQTLGKMSDWSSEIARAERASGHAERDVQAQRGSRRELEQQVRAALDALEKEKAAPPEADPVRAALTAPEAGLPTRSEKNPGGSAERTEKLAETLRADAERLGTLAAGLSKVAQALDGEAAAKKPLPATHADAAVQSALQALSEAEAAELTGAMAEAGRSTERASRLLDYAAEAERDRAEGVNQLSQWPMGSDSPRGSSRRPGAAPKSAPRPTPGNLKTPPPGLPIDLATWNRLPESMRRDLLNAQGQRFPAEYEQSIRRYFKNLASAKEDER